MSVIQVQKLSKQYNSHPVLHEVDFEIESGRLVGFLGPNGAGKTTTLRILLGLLAPSSGDASIFGKSCHRYGKLIRNEIGYLPGDVHLYSNLSGQAVLEFFSAARKRDCGDEIRRLASVFDLDIRRTVRKYSTGMKQKLGLIQALMHKPQLLILDEPTSALDPLVRRKVFDELKQVVAEGRSVLFSSHSLSEVEELCDEVIILRQGRIVEHQPIEVLKQRALRHVEIVFSGRPPVSLPESLKLAEQKGRLYKFTWTGETAELVSWLNTQTLDDVIIARPDLNDLFMTYYAPAGRPMQCNSGESHV